MKWRNTIPAILLTALCLLAACATVTQNWTPVGPVQAISLCPRCGSFVLMGYTHLYYSADGSKKSVVTDYQCLSTMTCGLISSVTNNYVLTVPRLASPKARN